MSFIGDNKRFKKDNIGKYGFLLYQIKLSNRWLLIITSLAERFYFDLKNKQSVWQMPIEKDGCIDKDLSDAYQYLNDKKDLILCLLALIRGAKIPWNIITQIKTEFNLSFSEKKNQKQKQSKDEEIRKEQISNEIIKDSSSKNGRNDDSIENNSNDENNDIGNSSNDENDEFALNYSDLEDLLGDDDDEQEKTLSSGKLLTKTDISDPILSEYADKYPILLRYIDPELSICVKFIQLLESLKIDIYSSYDLEIDNIVQNPDFIISNSNKLDDEIRRDLWDEYCRVEGLNNENNDDLNGNIVNMDTPELKYIEFLKIHKDEKLPKFHTDFNRLWTKKSKKENDSTYLDLCTDLPMSVRVNIYGKWFKWLKLSDNERIKFYQDVCKKLKLDGMKVGDVLNLIKSRKLLNYYDCFFFNSEDLKLLCN
jgi:hypothetical protein